MSRKCTVCTHPKRAEIDKALVANRAIAGIATDTGLDRRALERHKANHLPARLVKATEAREVANADTLLGQVQDLNRRTVAILDKLEAAETFDARVALQAIREIRANLELLAKLTGELAQVNILVVPQWQALRALIWAALEPYPDATEALDQRLLTLAVRDA